MSSDTKYKKRPVNMGLEQWIAANVQRDSETDCLVWTGGRLGKYGAIHFNHMTIGAHRAAFQLAHGKLPDGLVVRHLCNNPLCVNIDHLAAGTPMDNAWDRTASRRGRILPGEDHPQAKISNSDAKRVFDLSAKGFSQSEIRGMTGVGAKTVDAIVNGRDWLSVTTGKTIMQPPPMAFEPAGEFPATPKIDAGVAPLTTRRPSGLSDLQWIMMNVQKDERTGCLNWLRNKNKQGYGQLKIGARNVRAHRVVASLTQGVPLSSSAVVRHLCHNPSCVNPEHLAFGTTADNTRDMIVAGRAVWPVGQRNGMAKLSDASAREILEARLHGESTKQIAERMGVSRTVVDSVSNGSRWAHATGVRYVPGMKNRGSRNGNNALTEGVVTEIVELSKAGVPRREIAARTGVSYPTVNSILSGKNWSWLTGLPRIERPKRGKYKTSTR